MRGFACGPAVAAAEDSPYQRERYSSRVASSAATSAMPCCFSEVVPWMKESSHMTPTSPFSGRPTPMNLPQAITARETSMSAPCSAFSFFLMFLMSALLSDDTSVAVLTYPMLSVSK